MDRSRLGEVGVPVPTVPTGLKRMEKVMAWSTAYALGDGHYVSCANWVVLGIADFAISRITAMRLIWIFR